MNKGKSMTEKANNAQLRRALAMADCVLGNLLAAYEKNDMEQVKLMLENMRQRRTQAVLSITDQPQIALH